MGIPRLTGHLDPYSVPLLLRHQAFASSQDVVDASTSLTPIIVDGPALASHIYFDGFLPVHKRPTRQARLELSLKGLVKTYNLFPGGFSVGAVSPHTPSPSWNPDQLFHSPLPLSSFHRHLPAPPFLVPAVLDGLAESRYSSITDVVPAEADVYCALAAFKLGGTILTSDSDLLVFDLGPKASVVFFNTLSISTLDSDSAAGSILKANTFKTAELAQKFQLPNLHRLTYEVKTDPTLSFSDALRRTKTPVAHPVNFRAFVEEYALPSSSSSSSYAATPITSIDSKPAFLDPRLSELIFQLRSSPSQAAKEIIVYLPLFLDDPTRSSSWAVSACIRHTTYSFLTCHLSPNSVIAETSRQGYRILSTGIPPVSDPNLQHLLPLLKASQQNFPTLHPSLSFRVFALAYIHQWHIEHDKTPPSRASVLRALTGQATTQHHLAWEAIHLNAQVEGVLYALRMLRQSLHYLGDVAAAAGDGLAGLLEDHLPDLMDGLCSSWEEVRGLVVEAGEGLDVGCAMDFILNIEDEPTTNEGHEREEADGEQEEIAAEWQRPKKRKSGRSSKVLKSKAPPSAPKARNLYELLGSRPED
ncbi:MAG: hypothetical protein LQ341_003291 [Variospora aurantia]|nr:MAG: hypothetical protein LQ341_003291 [Variospora aurantia]